MQTPNLSNVKAPKLRVLFQSPTPARQHALSSVTTPSASSINPLHTLQKSISSASLKIESSSDSSSCGANSTQSAPVSRQQSHELSNNLPAVVPELDEVDVCCMTPLKVISAAAQQLISVADKKTVGWDDRRLLDIEEFSNPCTPVQQSSRYKSEPNLCSMRPQVHNDHDVDDDENAALTPIIEVSTTQASTGMGKSLTRKLMKGVSMHNLRFPFSTPETTKRLVRSVSATLKRRPNSTDCAKNMGCPLQSADGPLLEDMDDSDLDDEDDDTLSETNGSSNELPGGMTVDISYHQQLMQSSVYRNLDLITSTPALRLGRRSMSPITKSTQRMPKAMQVSSA